MMKKYVVLAAACLALVGLVGAAPAQGYCGGGVSANFGFNAGPYVSDPCDGGASANFDPFLASFFNRSYSYGHAYYGHSRFYDVPNSALIGFRGHAQFHDVPVGGSVNQNVINIGRTRGRVGGVPAGGFAAANVNQNVINVGRGGLRR